MGQFSTYDNMWTQERLSLSTGQQSIISLLTAVIVSRRDRFSHQFQPGLCGSHCAGWFCNACVKHSVTERSTLPPAILIYARQPVISVRIPNLPQMLTGLRFITAKSLVNLSWKALHKPVKIIFPSLHQCHQGLTWRTSSKCHYNPT